MRRTSSSRVGPPGSAASRLQASTSSAVAMSESSRCPRGSVRAAGCGVTTSVVVGRPCARHSDSPPSSTCTRSRGKPVQPHQPVAPDRVPTLAVVVEDQPAARRHSPGSETARAILAARDEVHPPHRSGVGARAGLGHVHMQVAEGSSGDVGLAVDVSVHRHMHESKVGVDEMFGQPLPADDRPELSHAHWFSGSGNDPGSVPAQVAMSSGGSQPQPATCPAGAAE